MSRCLSGFSFRMCRTHLLVELAGGQVEGLLRSVVPAAVQPLPGTGVSEGLVEGRGGGGEGRGGEGRGGEGRLTKVSVASFHSFSIRTTCGFWPVTLERRRLQS